MGAFGKAVPSRLQQFDVGQVVTAWVTYTPASVAMYTVFASLGSTRRPLAGTLGRFLLMFSQVAPKFVER